LHRPLTKFVTPQNHWLWPMADERGGLFFENTWFGSWIEEIKVEWKSCERVMKLQIMKRRF